MIAIIILKFINVIFDTGITYLIFLLSNKDLKKTLFYAINPVTILITTLHGQFDIIPIFFVLISIYFSTKKRYLTSILSFSFAILVKTWPILFFAPLVRKVKNKKLIISIIFIPVLFSFIYIWLFGSNLIDVGKTLMHYQGLWGIWGPWGWIGKIQLLYQKTTTILFLISFFGFSFITNEKNIVKNIYQLLIFFFIFTTNFSIQYFAWLVPFLILISPKKYSYLIILITIYLLSFYSIWIFCTQCKGISHWLVLIQNVLGLILWISFIKIWCLSKKTS